MSTHYDAFISYKHGEIDTKVASEVQTQLERFRIPKAIQRSTGIRRINRIFRDKEELNITSDLNDTIENALQNSDYLIVICSTHTKESIWVQREIEFFLKSHPMEKVMTVVAEGEPVDVVPEILFHREMELMTEDGAVKTVQVPMEPLSCDYRMKFSRARREELPRLAAAILGCGYDDLRQRQRRYRQRRMTVMAAAAAAALVALTGYYAYTAARIRENYEQALINQSEYLSSESRKSMEAGDRMTAMLLAMEALPSEGDDRPVTASAQLALSQALYAYQPAGGNATGVSAGIKRSFDHGGAIDRFAESPNGTYLVVTHSGDMLTMWKGDEGEVLFEERFNANTGNLVFTNENTLVLSTDIEICCFDPETGEKLWSHYCVPTADSPDTIMTDSFFNTHLAVSPTDAVMAVENGTDLHLIDTVTGQVLHTHRVEKEEYARFGDRDPQLYDLTFSPDGKLLAGAISLSSGLYPEKHPFVFNVEKKEFHVSTCAMPQMKALTVTDAGRVFAAGSLIADEFSYSMDGYEYFYINEMDVFCFDPATDAVIWGNSFSFSDYLKEAHMFMGSCPTETGEKTPALICGAANVVAALDPGTGQLLSTLSFEDTIMYLEEGADNILCLMENGNIAVGNWDMFIGSTEMSVGDLEKASLKGRNLVLPRGSASLLWYSNDVFDEDWTAFPEGGRYDFSHFHYEENGCGILEGWDKVFYHVDPSVQAVTWSLSMDPEGKQYQYLGWDTVNNQYVFYSGTDETLLRYTRSGEKISETALARDIWQVPEWEEAETIEETLMSYYAAEEPELLGDMVYYVIQEHSGNGGRGLVVERGDTVVTIPLSIEGTYISQTYPSPDGKYILLKDNLNLYYQADLEQGGCHPTDWTISLSDSRVAWSEDSRFLAVADMNQVRIFSEEGELRLDTAGETVVDLEFLHGMLLAIYSDGNLIRYDPTDGSFLGQVDVSGNQGFSPFTTVTWDFSCQERYGVFIDDTFNLIDPETWEVYAQVGSVVAYDLDMEILVVPRTLPPEEATETERYELGYFRLYSPEQLVEKAKAALGGTVLTQEQRAHYGLS